LQDHNSLKAEVLKRAYAKPILYIAEKT